MLQPDAITKAASSIRGTNTRLIYYPDGRKYLGNQVNVLNDFKALEQELYSQRTIVTSRLQYSEKNTKNSINITCTGPVTVLSI